jgi:hypothetical protein
MFRKLLGKPKALSQFLITVTTALVLWNVNGQNPSNGFPVGDRTNTPPIKITLTVPDGVSVTNILTVKPDQQIEELLKQGTGLLKAATSDKWFKKEWFVSTLLGAVVAVATGWFLHRREVRDRKREDGEFTQKVLKAIEAELDALRDIFNQGIGGQLKAKTGRMFLIRLALSQDYFTVYRTNAVHLGKMDPEIAKAVITLYQNLRALIEDFRINNEYIQMHDAAMYELRSNPTRYSPEIKRVQEVEGYLGNQGDHILKLNEQVEQQYLALKALLRERRERLPA